MTGESNSTVLVASASDLSNISSPTQIIKAKGIRMSHDMSSSQGHKLQQSDEHLQNYNPATVMPTSFSFVKESGLVLFSLAFLGFTLYLSCYLWRKHRCRTMAAISKGCQYSRLNQTETDEIDSVVFCSEPLQENNRMDSPWEDNEDNDDCKPATLEVITDSLITTSNYSSHTPNGIIKSDHSITSIGSDLSDEDLLQ